MQRLEVDKWVAQETVASSKKQPFRKSKTLTVHTYMCKYKLQNMVLISFLLIKAQTYSPTSVLKMYWFALKIIILHTWKPPFTSDFLALRKLILQMYANSKK